MPIESCALGQYNIYMRFASALVLLLFATGCAHYEYNIVQPDNLQAHIASKLATRVKLDPLEYSFRAVEDYLVIRIYNTANDPIHLVGERSTVVSPEGQSHPLRPMTIAPGSFIKLIFPPMRPRLEPVGPTIGIGFGMRAGRHFFAPGYPVGYPYAYPPYYAYDEPRYFIAYGPDESYYWDWDGETDVTATFVYRRNDKEFQHRFVFHRQKM